MKGYDFHLISYIYMNHFILNEDNAKRKVVRLFENRKRAMALWLHFFSSFNRFDQC